MRSALRGGAALAIALAVALAPQAASAGGKSKSPQARAAAQAAGGRKLIEQGDFAGALRELQAAQAVFPEPVVNFDIGVALQGLGRDAEASDSYRAFIVQSVNPPPDLLTRAQRAIAEIDAKQSGGRPDAVGAGPAAAPPPTRQRWWLLGAGTTVALGAGTVVSGILARSRYHELLDSCGKTVTGCAPSDIDGERTRIRVTNILLVATALSAAATGVLVFVEARSDRKEVGVAWRF